MKNYDYAIIGAGINGTLMAYYLHNAGKSVILIDEFGIASGGSGAAGAFVSPKFALSGELKLLHSEAYKFAKTFYKENFLECCTFSPLLHIAKDELDEEKIQQYKKEYNYHLSSQEINYTNQLTHNIAFKECVVVEDALMVDTIKLCRTLAKDVELKRLKVEVLNYENEHYIFDDFTASNVVLTTGAYTSPLKEPYIKIRPIWGHRIDIKSSTKLDFSLHHHLSVSTSSKEGLLALGATHNVHYNPENADETYDMQEGRAELLKRARFSIDLKDVEIVSDFVGLRAGSNDYLPHVGRVIKAKESLEKFPQMKNGRYIEPEALIYHPNLTLLNGVGGYGFVLAPFLASALSEYLLEEKAIFKEIDVGRFFYRYAKKVKTKNNL